MKTRPPGLRWACVGLLLVLGSHAEARTYTLSVEAEEGRERLRSAYLDEIRRALAIWVGSSGAFGAPSKHGVADLHLVVVLDDIELKRTGSGGDAFGSAQSGEARSTLFEFRIHLQDPHQEDRVLFEDAGTKPRRRWNEHTWKFLRISWTTLF